MKTKKQIRDKIKPSAQKSNRTIQADFADCKLSDGLKISAVAAYYDLGTESLTPLLILHKMAEVLEMYLKMIQQILQPEEFYSLHECAAFDDAEKAKLFELYSRIMITHREIVKASILNDDKNYLSTIQYVHSEVLAIKPLMLEVVKKAQHSWKLESRKEFQRGNIRYFG